MKTILASLTLFAVIATAQAQTNPGAPTINQAGNSLPPGFTKKVQAVADSDADFRAHNYARAEATLLAANQSPSGTPRWHCESGAALMRVAFAFRARFDAVTATDVAQRALAHLKQAEQGFGPKTDPAELANENEMAGYLCEHLLGDRTQAKRYYQAAVNLSPKSGHAAELLAAILVSEAEEAKKRNYVPGQ